MVTQLARHTLRRLGEDAPAVPTCAMKKSSTLCRRTPPRYLRTPSGERPSLRSSHRRVGL